MLELERELELELELELERRLEPRLERRLGRRLEPRLGLELDELVELGERRCFRLPVFFAARRGVGLWLSAVSLRSSEARRGVGLSAVSRRSSEITFVIFKGRTTSHQSLTCLA